MKPDVIGLWLEQTLEHTRFLLVFDLEEQTEEVYDLYEQRVRRFHELDLTARELLDFLQDDHLKIELN